MYNLATFLRPPSTGLPWVYDVIIKKLTNDGHVDTSGSFPTQTRKCFMQLTGGYTHSRSLDYSEARLASASRVTIGGFMCWLRKELPGVFFKHAHCKWRLQGVVPSARDVFVPRGACQVSFDEPEDSEMHLWPLLDVDMARFVRVYCEGAGVQFVCELVLLEKVRTLLVVWLCVDTGM